MINVPVPFAQPGNGGNMVAISDQRSLNFQNVSTGRYRTVFRVESGTAPNIQASEVTNNFFVAAANDLAVSTILEPPMKADYPISSNMNIRIRATVSNYSAVTPIDSFYAKARVYRYTTFDEDALTGTGRTLV
jgi:hypothetical protein